MNLVLDHGSSEMKVVYRLSVELQDDPAQVEQVQALSLDNTKPFLGLKPVHGLFGSDAWWESIREGRIRTVHVTGTLSELVFAGQDARWGDEVNAFELRKHDGSIVRESIYAHEKRDFQRFQVGAQISIWYALLELKRDPAPGAPVDHAETVLEMAVSPPPSG